MLTDPAYARAWLLAFLFTQAVEVPVYRLFLGPVPRRSALYALCFGASVVTHPALWFIVFPRLLTWPAPADLAAALGTPDAAYPITVACAEALVVAVEAVYLWLLAPRLGLPLSPRRALAAALLANGASVALGSLSRALTGYP